MKDETPGLTGYLPNGAGFLPPVVPAKELLSTRIIKVLAHGGLFMLIALTIFAAGWGWAVNATQKADQSLFWSAYCEGYLNGTRQVVSEDIAALLNDTTIEPDSLIGQVSQLLAERTSLMPLKLMIGVSTGDSLFYQYLQDAEGGL